MKQKHFFTMLTCLFMVIGIFGQQTIYVSATGAGLKNGTSEANAYDNFSTALGDINTASDILRIIGDISPGVINLSSKGFAYTIEGDTNGSTLTGSNGTLRMFTIDSNTASGQNVTFKNIIFTGSTDSTGEGGVFSSTTDAVVTFENCVFSGNSSVNTSGGGAINITASTTATFTGCTFYNNANNTGAGNSGQGGAIVFAGGLTSSLTNCTFFQNTISRTNNDFGAAIRIDGGASITMSNCLFYDNKTNNGAGVVADIGASAGGIQTFSNSLGQLINANIDNVTNSTVFKKGTTSTAADLSNSNLTWNATLNKVSYTAPEAITDDTPIDFGSDTSDVGAWDSKINIFKGGATGAVEAWINTTNWSNGALPTATDNVAILTGAACTLDSEATINDIKVTSRLDIKNNRVLIVNGTANVTGSVNYLRNLTNSGGLTEAWHLVSSPLSDEIFDGTFVTNNDIAINGSNNAIASYNPGQTGSNAWTYLTTGGTINAANGQGYAMKITPDGISTGDERADNVVTFQGNLNTNDAGVTTASLATGFNLVGNPYTSFVNSATFLAANANIDQTQIWIWDAASGAYEVKTSGVGFVVAPAQGFFVNVTSSGTLNFAEANQATTGAAFQKTAKTELKLVMTDGQNNRFAKIYFNEDATTGFDYGWEGETFGGIPNSLDVYTHLLEGNEGKKYQVQSLPKAALDAMVIPVGVIAAAGKELTFSLATTNFPSEVKVYLEDRLTNTFNELTASNSFKVTLSESSKDTGRFYVHTSGKSLSVADDAALATVRIFKSNASTLKLVGLPNGASKVTLFNVLGKQVFTTSFQANGTKEISLPNLTTGVYMIQLSTETSKINKKIVLE